MRTVKLIAEAIKSVSVSAVSLPLNTSNLSPSLIPLTLSLRLVPFAVRSLFLSHHQLPSLLLSHHRGGQRSPKFGARVRWPVEKESTVSTASRAELSDRLVGATGVWFFFQSSIGGCQWFWWCCLCCLCCWGPRWVRDGPWTWHRWRPLNLERWTLGQSGSANAPKKVGQRRASNAQPSGWNSLSFFM